MDIFAGGMYRDDKDNYYIMMGEVLHVLKIKDEFAHEYQRKGQAEHTETGEILDLFLHKDGAVIAVTKGITQVITSDILVVYQDVESKKTYACPSEKFEKKNFKRAD